MTQVQYATFNTTASEKELLSMMQAYHAIFNAVLYRKRSLLRMQA